jgi:hypothetical protein
MATALSYPTISGVTTPPYLSALSETANIQNTINFLYYGSADSGTTPRTSLSTSSGIYGMLSQLQTQISAVQSGVNVHESAKWATTTTLAAVYAAGTADASNGTGIGATITFSATGVQKIDSTTTDIALNDRVLVKNGTTALSGTSSTANGIYYVSTAPAIGVAGILTRALDSDNSIAGEMAEGDFLYVSDGDANANEGYILTTSSATGTGPAGSIRIGTDGVTYTQFIGVGSYYVGTTAAQIASANQNVTGILSLAMPSSSGGIFTLTPAASASSFAITIPAAADTLVGKATTDILTNKSLSDSTTHFVDNSDNTKRVNIDVTGTTGITGVLQTAFTTAKTIAFPDTAGTVYVSTGTDVSLADGGTNASLTASNGGIVWSNATQLQILAGTATAGKLLRSGASVTPAWSTATFPDTATTAGTLLRADGTNWVATTATYPTTTTINNLIYSSATNVIGQVTAPTTNGTYALTSVVSASASVTPTWATATGTGNPVFSTSPTFATSVIGSTSMDVFNTASTTVNAFGAATTMNLGTAATTVTIGQSGTLGTGTNTFSLFTGSSTTGTTQNINIGTGQFSLATQNINIGTNATSGLTATRNINIGTSASTSATTTTTIAGTVINSGDGVILKTASFTVGAGERNYNVTGTASVTVTLPTATAGRTINIVNKAAFTIVSASSNVMPRTGIQTMGTAICAAAVGSFATLVADGSNWYIMAGA